MPDSPLTIAIAGASGFVGQAFLDRFASAHELVGLSRRPRSDDARCEWRACDMYSRQDCEAALRGCDVAVYLVHSMSPSARLTQASFADLDLILADNFARAAAKVGVRRIVYLGGLIPDTGELSDHLESRREVEHALAAQGTPVTVLRAGMVVGAQGSSFQILATLVDRLPAMLLPRWTQSRTQPIALDDVVTLLGAACEGQGLTASRDMSEALTVHDIGCPDVLTYRQMMADVAEVQGKRRWMRPVAFFSPKLSRMWVRLITGKSKELVGPLVESLRHDMVAHHRTWQLAVGVPGQPWRSALREAHVAWKVLKEKPVASSEPSSNRSLARRPAASTVRSVQRLPRPQWMSAEDAGREYLRWLPEFLGPALKVEVEGLCARFYMRPAPMPLLVLQLSPERSSEDRSLFEVVGGLLAEKSGPDGRPGRLEFRAAPDGRYIIAAIHDFVPRLPWFVYTQSQARVHLWVMKAFGRHLGRLAQRAMPPATASATESPASTARAPKRLGA